MTDKPDYSEMIERARADAARQAETSRWLTDLQYGPNYESVKAENTLIWKLAAALTHLSAENDRLRHEADTMIAAGLGARIDASMDNDRLRGGDLQKMQTSPGEREPVPDGWKMVPVEPTPAMLERAAFNLCVEYGVEFVKPLGTFVKDAYAELLAASPPPSRTGRLAGDRGD